MNLRHRQSCRVCGSRELSPVINLGAQYLQGSFVKPGVASPPTRQIPVELVRCDVTRNENGCGLVQLAHSIPSTILFANYWYRSGTNATMRNHLTEVAKSATAELGRRELSVLDIGCNDGTLLLQYPEGTRRYGVDPSDIAREIGGDAIVINSTFPSPAIEKELPRGSLDIVTSIAVYYDVEDPVEFARAVARLLNPDGIWVVEVSYMPLMLKQNSFDTICHEHLEYYSLASIEKIAALSDLRVFRASINDTNGGSICCYLCPAADVTRGTAEDREVLLRLQLNEFQMALDTEVPYREFCERAEQLRNDLRALLARIRGDGNRIHIYGASTKGNVLLQWCGIDHAIIECAADRNPRKAGSKTLGTEIPIVSEEESRRAKPGYYLVLPWHFKHEFLKRERELILGGTKMIFPLPRIEIVTSENLDGAIASSARASTHMMDMLFEQSAV